MKKITIVLVFIAMFLAACSQDNTPVRDQSVREALEALNGQTSSSGRPYLDVNLSDDQVFLPISEADALELISSGTGVIVFEYPECPWCRSAMPVMDDAARRIGLDTIYAFNIREHRNEINLENGELVVKNEGSEFYRKVLEILGDDLPVYEGLNDESLRRIYVPLVLVLKDGKVEASHLATVESQTDPYVALSDDQRQELLDIYLDMFAIMPGCSIEKAC